MQISQENKKQVVTIPEDLQLSHDERKVLSRGLSFIPVNQNFNKSNTQEDLQRFFRRVKLHAHFNDPDKPITNIDDNEDSLLNKYKKSSSSWTPSDVHPSINNFISHCKEDIDNINSKKIHTNITKSEYAALEKLKKNDDIVIKKADKGGAVVVWGKDLYILEGIRQLSNKEFYEELRTDNTNENNERVKKAVTKETDDGNLTQDCKVLIQKKPRCSVFYMLPKIRKIDSPGRPIVSACSCPTELIGSFVDDILQPLVKNLPSFCKDTDDVLVKIDQCKNSVYESFFTMDVKSLYTIIPHAEGLSAIKYFLEQRIDKTPPTDTIVRLAELVLTLNTFEFNDQFYRQVKGVAMGTKMGPSFANLFLGFVEKNFLEHSLYIRYIDDIFGLSTMTEDDLRHFIDAFCNFHPAVEFTFDIAKKVNFLDISLSIESVGISTSVYYKSTDSHLYLDYQSNHSPSCKNAIPYSQFLRLRRLCSNDEDFKVKVNEMSQFFLDRGYPLCVVTSAREKVFKTSRETLLYKKSSLNVSRKIPLVLKYNQFNSRILSIVRKNYLQYLSNDVDIGKMFENNFIGSFCNEKSLSNH